MADSPDLPSPWEMAAEQALVVHSKPQLAGSLPPISSGHTPHCLSAENHSPSPSTRDQARSAVHKFLRNKEQEWKAVADRKRPLTLLELPVDVLRLIVKEMTHTNDLTALALTNSTLHNLAIPHIYSRFDIVWPDGHVASTDSKSVDALTYGLSTLCLGSSFSRTTKRLYFPDVPGPLTRFQGNEYAKYTRKFSLGNGPNEWVAEYMITKESGKMLGTLVALAVAKMINLETFVWDMSTGVLSDVFMALASLPDHHEANECKLERVWIRWHDNSEGASQPNAAASPLVHPPAVVPVGSTLTPIGIMLPSNAAHPPPRNPISYAEHNVEYPTFSVLPALKSLTVLEIDELAYLDEMADLLERSKDRLHELRVGISPRATHKDFVQTWDGSGLQQVDHNARWPGESTIGERRLGGVLGVLVGKIYDIRRKTTPKGKEKAQSSGPSAAAAAAAADAPPPLINHSEAGQEQAGGEGTTANGPSSLTLQVALPPPLTKADGAGGAKAPSQPCPACRKRLEGKLKLHTLELERIPLSMQVCRHAIDWSVLTSLTLLECAQHENLWKLLRRQFQPTPVANGYGIAATKPPPNAPLQYHLALKRIHTDITSLALINFLKDTLAPNSLEILFLQDRKRGSGPPQVTISQIFKGPVKRHRSSLRKLLLDSSSRASVQGGTGTADHLRWRNWVLTTDILMYITSGRMPNLRELAVSLEYKDWHTFLRRLPNISQLRSLNIPYLADHVGNFEPKELALQIVDIITLRPEIKLCYVGLSTKCFEILESRPTDSRSSSGSVGHNGASSHMNAAAGAQESTDDENGEEDEDTSDDEEDGEETDNDDDDDDENDDEDGAPTSPTDPDETQSENSGAEDSDDDSFVEPEVPDRTQLRLREILFYDDKVAIFKARHGKL